jgi:hypothetical protein
MTRPPGRPKGTHPAPRFTVLVSFKVEPVTAARLRAEARPGESVGTAARRILVEALAAMAAEEKKT